MLETRSCGAAAGWMALLVLAGCSTAEKPPPAAQSRLLSIQEYAQERAVLRDRLAELQRDLVPRLEADSPEERSALRRELLAFLQDQITPHTQHETDLLGHTEDTPLPFEQARNMAEATHLMRGQHAEILSTVAVLQKLESMPSMSTRFDAWQVRVLIESLEKHLEAEQLVIEEHVAREPRTRTAGAERDPW